MVTMTDPILSAPVTDVQRDRAVEYLQRAYAASEISDEMFEQRLGLALTATTRAELNASLRGLARVAPSMLVGQPTAPPQPVNGMNNVLAGIIHLGTLPSMFVLPAIAKGAASPQSRISLEASRAMCFQFSALIYGAIAIFLTAMGITPASLLFVGFVSWALMTLWLAIRAFNGDHSTKAIEKLMLMRPVEDQQPRVR
ncbi:DUF1707 and DUF4870 domain-containing protein [Arachnia propionica]|uniref:DUF1707 and DUF4870 domain-containing protein n=2 Tax=Arachnia propionica TaxID=1750 RepID=A0A3P1TC09_9ACTN|nr:DUF1707 and DUF4870 domain-containing protein [Arachnia propionica]